MRWGSIRRATRKGRKNRKEIEEVEKKLEMFEFRKIRTKKVLRIFCKASRSLHMLMASSGLHRGIY